MEGGLFRILLSPIPWWAAFIAVMYAAALILRRLDLDA